MTQMRRAYGPRSCFWLASWSVV